MNSLVLYEVRSYRVDLIGSKKERTTVPVYSEVV